VAETAETLLDNDAACILWYSDQLKRTAMRAATYNRAAHIVSHSLFNVVSVVVRGLVLSLGKVLGCFHTLNVGAR